MFKSLFYSLEQLKTFAIVLIIFSAATVSCSKQVTPPHDYSAEELVKSLYIGGPEFSADGTKILYTSDELGSPGIWSYNSLNDTHTVLIDDPQKALYSLAYYGEDDNLVYISNENGGQNTQLFVKEGGKIISVTDGLEVRALYRGLKADKSGFYYTANKRSPRTFDLFEYVFEKGESLPVFENNTSYSIGKVSSNHEYIILHESVTEEVANLFVYHISDEKLIPISPDQNDNLYRGKFFSADNESLYYLTNEGSEFTYIGKYSIKEKVHEVIWMENWNIVDVDFSEDESLMAVYVNENGRPKVRLVNLETKREIPNTFLSQHQVTSLVFNPDNSKVGLRVTESDRPREIWLLDLENNQAELVVSSLNPKIDPQYFSEPEDIMLTASDNVKVPAFLYKPIDYSNKPGPALVWTHGGPGGQFLRTYNEYIQFMVLHGYTVIAVNNRGSSGYGKTFKALDNQRHGLDDMKDIIAAKRYVEALPEVDNNRIGIIGDSYGGYLVLAALAFHQNEFDAGVDMFGISNWLHVLNSMPVYWEARREALYNEIGHPVLDSVMLYNKSPLFFSNQIEKPLMVIQGSNDSKVPQSESDQIVEKVKENGIPVDYLLFDDEGHGIRKDENKIEAMNGILNFFNNHLNRMEQ